MASFQCASFQRESFQTNCSTPLPPTDDHHGGLFLNPPPGWRAIGPGPHRQHQGRAHGPLHPDKVLTHLDFNRDDPDELWLLGLEDLETN